MDEQELRELSRRAVRLMPGWIATGYYKDGEGQRWRLENGGFAGFEKWLHTDTEACTEIMVRVLMPQRVDLDWVTEGTILASQRPDQRGTKPSRILVSGDHFNDPMLAYRVAVLKALCALYEKA